MHLDGLFQQTFRGLNVLLTGHTGFKGSWLTLWLHAMGANVVGFSLPSAPTMPSNFELAGLSARVADVRGDIRDLEQVFAVIQQYRPELVIHFAAQTTVIPSYADPKVSFDTNAGGTVNVLEAVRTTDSVRAVVVCTTDKVYENKEWIWGYRESDRLGGHDPYSTSKAMAELATLSYRRSFFENHPGSQAHQVAVGTVRAGNVIGGGDFTEYGLVADCMAALMAGKPITLRNPQSVRPWQYVLEPLSGYLLLAARLLQADGQDFADAWNFGPLHHKDVTTQILTEQLIALWGAGSWVQTQPPGSVDEVAKPHETTYLHLNWDKAASYLQWRPVFSIEEALAETVKWYRAYQARQDMYEFGLLAIGNYVQSARDLHVVWTR